MSRSSINWNLKRAIIGVVGIAVTIYSMVSRSSRNFVNTCCIARFVTYSGPARLMWTNTGITLSQGQEVEITTTGTVNIAA